MVLMATQIESTGPLERKLALSVAIATVEREVGQRLKKLSRTLRMPGFRPGKVPMKMIERSHGPQMESEVLGEAISQGLAAAIKEHDLRVAGEPHIERGEAGDETQLAFTATFEVYPEVVLGDFAALEIERVTCTIGDAEVDKTVEILRKQRVTWNPVERAAQDGDQVTIAFTGTLDGVAFDGGSGSDFPFVLGEGRMLPDFETGVRGMKAGETRTVAVNFPEDYGSKDLAGKEAQFEISVSKVEEPVLPVVDQDFARQLGVEDGDVEKMRADIRANLEREVLQRTRARTKSNLMDVLPSVTSFELPQSLVRGEEAALTERALADLKDRGIDTSKLPVPEGAFTESAQKRVRLGLLVAEIVNKHSLQAKPEQVRAQIEEFAQAYESPEEVLRYYFGDRERLAQVESLVVEQNVVDWVLANAKVQDKAIDFDELMKG
jgi:trigger factor